MKYYSTIKEFLQENPARKQDLKQFIQIDNLDCRISIFNDNDTIEDLCLELDLPVDYCIAQKVFQKNRFRDTYMYTKLDLIFPSENREVFHKGSFVNKSKAKKDLMKLVSIQLNTDLQEYQDCNLDGNDNLLYIENNIIKSCSIDGLSI